MLYALASNLLRKLDTWILWSKDVKLAGAWPPVRQMPFAISTKVASDPAKSEYTSGSISLHILRVSEEQSPHGCTGRLLEGKYYFLSTLLDILYEEFPKRQPHKDMSSIKKKMSAQNCLAIKITRNPKCT